MIQNPLAASMMQKPMQSAARNMSPQIAPPAPAPMNPTGSMGLQQSMPSPPNNALMQAIGGGLNAFRKSFDPEGHKASQDEAKAAEGDKLKQTLALMQQQRALPEEQRAAWWQQNAPIVSKIYGQDVSKMPVDPAQFSNQALDGNIAALSAQAGIGPVVPEPMNAYQAALLKQREQEMGQPTPFNLGDGAFAEYDPSAPAGSRLNLLREQTEAPADLPEGMWRGEDGKGPPQPIPGYVGMRTQIARGSQSPSSTADTYRPATPQDLASWGIPAGTAVKINNRTGEPQVISGAKPASEYTPTQQSKFIQQAQTLDAVDGALKAYTDLIDAAGPQLWTTGIGGDNPIAKKLDAARTAILIQAKELFNLGVLNGPDLEIISSAVPDVTGSEAIGKSAASAKAQLSVLTDYISRGRNQIPTELLERARPNATKTTAGATKTRVGVPFLLAKPTNTAAAGVPDGVDPADWEFMTPEQKALFQ